MDDDGSKSLSYYEFRKGIYDYGLNMEEDVSAEPSSVSIRDRVCCLLRAVLPW